MLSAKRLIGVGLLLAPFPLVAADAPTNFDLDVGFSLSAVPGGVEPHLSLETYLTLVNSRMPPTSGDLKPLYANEYVTVLNYVASWDQQRHGVANAYEILGLGLGAIEGTELLGKTTDALKPRIEAYYHDSMKAATQPLFDAMRAQSFYGALAKAAKAAPQDQAWAEAEDALAKIEGLDQATSFLKSRLPDFNEQRVGPELNRLFIDYIKNENKAIKGMAKDVAELKTAIAKTHAAVADIARNVHTLNDNYRDLKKRVEVLEKANKDNPSTNANTTNSNSNKKDSEPDDATSYKQAAMKFSEAAKVTASNLSAAANIANHLNVDPNVVMDLNVGAQAASLAAGVAACSANVLACLPAASSGFDFVSTVFGGRKQDPMAKLMQQLLQRLAEIERKMDVYHQAQMNELYRVEWNQLAIYEQANYFQSQALEFCTDLLKASAYTRPNPKRPELDWTILPNAVTSFATYAEFATHAKAYSASAISECEKGMVIALGSEGEPRQPVSPIFLKTPIMIGGGSAADTATAPKQAIQSAAAYDSKFDTAIGWYLKSDALILAMSLSTTSGGVDQKLREWLGMSIQIPPEAATTATVATPAYRMGFVEKNFAVAVDPLAARRVTSVLVGMNYYWQLAPDGKLANPQALLKSSLHGVEGSGTATQTLSRAIPLLDLTIAQQALRGGDILLPLAYQIWRNWENPTATTDEELVCGQWFGHELLQPLAVNPCEPRRAEDIKARAASLRAEFFEADKGLITVNALFATNLARYIVYQRLIDRHHGSTAYEVAWASTGSASWLGALLGYDLGLSFNPRSNPGQSVGSWWMTLANRQVELPYPDEVSSEALLAQPVTIQLVDVRYRILRELAGYTRPMSQPKIAKSP